MSVTVWKDEATGLWYFRHPNPARGEDHVTRADRTIIALAKERDDLSQRLDECSAACARYMLDADKAAQRIAALEAESDRLEKQRHAYRQEYDQQRERIAALEAAARRLLAAIPFHEELVDYVEYDVALDALVRELDR